MTEFQQQHTNPLYHPDHNIRSRAILELADGLDANGLDHLLKALATEHDIFVMEDITWALVQHREIAIQPLLELLSHPDPIARLRVVHTLGKMGDNRAVEALIPILQDADSSVVLKCIFVLGQIGDPSAIPALMGILGHDNVNIEGLLIEVLEGFGAHALPHLITATTHEQWQVREQAVSILGMIGNSEAIPALISTLQDDYWEVRFEAINALSQMKDNRIQLALTPLKDDPNSRVRALVNKLLK